MADEERYPDENAGTIDDGIVQQQKQLTESDAPQEVKRRQWSFFSRDSVYTNIPEKNLQFELWKIEVEHTEMVFWRDFDLENNALTFKMIQDDINSLREARNRLYRAVNGEFIKRLVPDIKMGYADYGGDRQQRGGSGIFGGIKNLLFGRGGNNQGGVQE